MNEINMTCKQFTKMFTVKVDQERRWVCSVGTDVDDDLIYNTSEEYHIGNAYATVDRFYIIDITEFDLLIDVAVADKHISQDYAVNQKKAVHIKYKGRTIDKEMTLQADISRFKMILYQDEVYTLGILARPVFENHISECIVYRDKEYYLGSDPEKLTTFVFTKIKDYSRRISNSFYVKGVFDAFQAGKQVRAITGVLYDPKKFCRLIAHVIDHKHNYEFFDLEDICGISMPGLMKIEQLAQNIAERVIKRETVMQTYRMKRELYNTSYQTAEDMSLRNAGMAYLPKIEMKNNCCRSIDDYQEWVSLELKIPYEPDHTYSLSVGLLHWKIIVVAVVAENSDKYYYKDNVTIAGCDVMKPGCEVSKSTYTDNLVLYAVRCNLVLPLSADQTYHKRVDLEKMFSSLQNLLKQTIKEERNKERDRISLEESVVWAERTAEKYKQEKIARLAQLKAEAISEEHARTQKENDRQATLDEQIRIINSLFMHSENTIPRADYEEWVVLDYPWVNTENNESDVSSEIKRGSFGVWKSRNVLFFVNCDRHDANDSEDRCYGCEIELDQFKQAVLYAEQKRVISNEDSKKYIKNALKLRYSSKHDGSSVCNAKSKESNHIVQMKIEASEESIAALKDAMHPSNDLFMASRAEKHAAEVKAEDRRAALEEETASVRRIFMQTEGLRDIPREHYEEWFILDFKCSVDGARSQLEHGSLGVDKSMNKLFFVSRSSHDLNDPHATISGHEVDLEDFKQAVRYAEREAYISPSALVSIIKKALKVHSASKTQKNDTQKSDSCLPEKSKVPVVSATKETTHDPLEEYGGKRESTLDRIVSCTADIRLSRMKYEEWFSFEWVVSTNNNMKYHGSVGLDKLSQQLYLVDKDRNNMNDYDGSLCASALSYKDFKVVLLHAEQCSCVSRKKTNKYLNDAMNIEKQRKMKVHENDQTHENSVVQKDELKEAVDHLKKGGELLFSSLASAASRLFSFGKKK